MKILKVVKSVFKAIFSVPYALTCVLIFVFIVFGSVALSFSTPNGKYDVVLTTPEPINVAAGLNDISNAMNEAGYVPPLMKVEATGYYDSYGHGYGADGRVLVEDLTIAGKVEWLGMSCALYDEDMRLIGLYEFRDTGYGQSTGKGKSKICPGKSIGTIECGQCVDIYFKTRQQCKEWGRRTVYMQLIKAEG